MTPDQRHPHASDPRPSEPAGVARRTAVAAAWTAPVVAAAVAAPGASASPAPVGTGTFVGVAIKSAGTLRLRIIVFANGDATADRSVALGQETELRITVEHDVIDWGIGLVPESPRAARLVVPAGSYPVFDTYRLGGRTVAVAVPVPALDSVLADSPPGSFFATIAVVRGPVYPGPDPSATKGFGLPSARASITV